MVRAGRSLTHPLRPSRWQVRDRTLSNEGHTLVMGIVNVTPDSFADGGRYAEPDLAVTHGIELVEQGADLVDIGGESTRPGAEAVPPGEELRRVVPVVRSLAEQGTVVSVDTSKAVVAEEALEAGAAIVNDVTALGDPEMAGVVANYGAGLVLMHMQGMPRTMQQDPNYEDVVSEVRDFLLDRATRAEKEGIDRHRICIDPGIGFGKTVQHNLSLLAGLPILVETGYPVLVGVSRKSFIGHILGAIPPDERDPGTGAAHAVAISAGVAVIRAHNVAAAVHTARMADAIVRAKDERGLDDGP